MRQNPACHVLARSSQIKGADHCIQLQSGRGTTQLTFGGCCTVLEVNLHKPKLNSSDFQVLHAGIF
jgi:hypothetical protein